MSKKRLSEFTELEIININNGEKYGYLGDCEMNFDIKTGQILSISASEGKSSIFSLKEDNFIEIPWGCKIKQSDRTIIFDCKL